MSLMSRRVRVPQDVRIVTASNSGMRPPFSCSVACLENDLNAQAEAISGAMLDCIVVKNDGEYRTIEGISQRQELSEIDNAEILKQKKQ